MDNITAIAQMLSEELARALPGAAKMSAVERKVRYLLQEIGRQAVTTYLQAQETAYPAPATACPHCEQQASYVRRRPNIVHNIPPTPLTSLSSVVGLFHEKFSLAL